VDRTLAGGHWRVKVSPLGWRCRTSGADKDRTVDATGYPCPGDQHPRARSWDHPGGEARRRHVCLIESLGIYLPCQVVRAELRVAGTSVRRW
jgi:hypothetical protein